MTNVLSAAGVKHLPANLEQSALSSTVLDVTGQANPVMKGRDGPLGGLLSRRAAFSLPVHQAITIVKPGDDASLIVLEEERVPDFPKILKYEPFPLFPPDGKDDPFFASYNAFHTLLLIQVFNSIPPEDRTRVLSKTNPSSLAPLWYVAGRPGLTGYFLALLGDGKYTEKQLQKIFDTDMLDTRSSRNTHPVAHALSTHYSKTQMALFSRLLSKYHDGVPAGPRFGNYLDDHRKLLLNRKIAPSTILENVSYYRLFNVNLIHRSEYVTRVRERPGTVGKLNDLVKILRGEAT